MSRENAIRLSLRLKRGLTAEDEHGNSVFIVSNTEIWAEDWLSAPNQAFILVHHPGLGDITEWLAIDKAVYEASI